MQRDATGDRRRYWEFLGWIVVLGGLLWLVGSWVRSATCADVQLEAQFAATSSFTTDTTAGCTLDQARSDIGRDYWFIVVYALGLAAFCGRWWGRLTFDSEPGKSELSRWIPVCAALAAAVFDWLETWRIRAGLGEPSGDETQTWTLDFAGTVNVLAWFKWIAVGVAVLAAVAIVLTWLVHYVRLGWNWLRNKVKDPKPELTGARWQPPSAEPDLAICCSGGGIRSAAFNLGALSALEATELQRDAWRNKEAKDQARFDLGLLGISDVLASVSGGGYAASGWRIAAGEGTTLPAEPIIGDPNADEKDSTKYPEEDLAEPEARNALYKVVRRRRHFLRNGRGGLFWSAVLALLMLAWHLALILGAVILVSWPLGRLIDRWVLDETDLSGYEVDIDFWGRLALPVWWALLIVGVLLVMRIGTQRGALRRGLDAALKGAMGLAAGLAFVLLALPWLLDVVVPAIEGIPGGDSPIPVILSGGLAATAFGLVRSTLETRLKYLGGVVLGIIAAVLALLVMDDAAVGGETFSLSEPVYLWGFLIYVAFSTFLNPDWWSLQWIYRLRMSQTFSNLIDDSGFRGRTRREQPVVSAYRDAAGPRSLICCAAAREDQTITGIPATSFTIDPDEVVVHQWVDGVLESEAMPTCDYEPWIAWTPQHRRQTGLIGAASLSGAAFAPSMGRISVGTTQAALAALNLRLGVWLPNPRSDKRSRPPLVNMFKEVFGQYDVDAPNLYVTDGGHWENLALVEMVRRRANVIICIDASGDEQYSHNTLQQAIELAQLECNVRIDIPSDEMKAMKRAKDERLPERNWAAGTIHYPAMTEAEIDGGRPEKVGRLLYVKAQRSRSMPLSVLRYGQEDATFPNYSTADQFLSDDEFKNLAMLGRHSMILAVREKRAVVFQDLVIGSPPAPEGEPDEEQKARLEEFWKRVVNTPFRPKDARYLKDFYPTSADGEDT